MLGDDHAAHADKGVGPVGGRLLKDHLQRMIVDLLDLDVAIGGDVIGSRVGIGRILPIEQAIIGCERLPIMPFHVLLQGPSDRQAIFRDAPALEARNLGREDGDEIAVRVPAGERLIEDARGLLILGADGEMRVEQGRGLPVEQFERTAAACLGGLIFEFRLSHGDAAIAQHLAYHRRAQAQGAHFLDEGTSRHRAGLHPRDQAAQLALLHVVSPWLP